MSVNYLTVIVCAVASMIIGSLWYSPLLFGNIWMKLQGFSKKDMNKAKQAGMWKLYLAAFIGSLVTASVLGYLIDIVGKNVSTGILLAFLAWLGFVATTLLGNVLWEGKSVAVYVLNILYYLVNLVVMGLILGAW
ncbi:MAG: hypothetical protein RL557_170 [archaeon]